MALYQQISGSSNLSIYGAGFWTFFNNNELCGDNCQGNAVLIENTENVNYFGINTRYVNTLVRQKGETLATSAQNAGGWGAAVAAFMTDGR
jgi:glucan 1,3-beta-glucosidase